jgi:cell division protein FtsQ
MGNKRRHNDKYLLDVKVHTEMRTRARARWIAAWATAALVLMLTSYGLYRAIRCAADRVVFENPQFAITRIAVESDGALTPQQVQRFAGVRVGQNIFAVNLSEVQRNLELIPMIQRVEVRRELPQRLVIRINERLPVARMQTASKQLSDKIFFVDRTGVVMTPIRLDDGTMLQPQSPRPLPVLTGAALADARVGRAVESEQVYRALALLDALEQSGAGATMEVEQVDLSKPRHLTLMTRQNMVVRFDVQDFRPQLRRLSAILAWAQQQQRVVASVDLTVNRGVPVCFAGGVAPTTRTTGAVRPVSTRRTN